MLSQRSLRSLPALALLALAAGCDRHEAPLAPPQRGDFAIQSAGDKIAFTSNRDGNNEIYVMNADGTGVTRLTNNPAVDQDPAWSPDGSRIAFTSTRDGNHELYVMNADGSGVVRLTTNTAKDVRPTWCGTRLAFESDQFIESFPDIYVMNDDGTGVTRLTTLGATWDRDPTWSPSCGQIAFTQDPGGNVDVYVINADGTGVSQLTSSPGEDQDPAWSPDGTRIAFSTQRHADQPPTPLDIREIYVMNADGTGETRLTTTTINAWNRNPAWSADGSQIAFESNTDGDYEIKVMNADGSGLTQLTSNSGGDWHPAWSGAAAPSADWPHEPPGFTMIENQPWDTFRTWGVDVQNGYMSLVTNQNGLFSGPNAIQWFYPQGTIGGGDPPWAMGHTWFDIPPARYNRQIFVGLWFKVDANFQGHPSSGVQKLGYLDADANERGGFWLELFGVNSDPLTVQVVTEFPGLPPAQYAPNETDHAPDPHPGETAVTISRGAWHRYEVYLELPATSPGNGTCQIWLDGTLVLNRTDMPMSFDAARWFDLHHDLIWGGVGDTKLQDNSVWLDHTYISGP